MTDSQKGWLDREKNRKYKRVEKNGEKMMVLKKSYPHFDLRIRYDNFEMVAKEVFDPKKIAEHCFFPMIKYIKRSKKYEKIDKRERKEKGINRKYRIRSKERPICYASHFDSLIFSWYGFQLFERYEKIINPIGLGENVLAYRSIEKFVEGEAKSKCNIDFAKEAFEEVMRRKNCVAVALDIKGFFENLNHKKIKKKWIKIMGFSGEELPADHYQVYKNLTKYRFINQEQVNKIFKLKKGEFKKRICSSSELNKKIRDGEIEIQKHEDQVDNKDVSCRYRGIPQGSPISAFLANIYMFDFDQKIKKFISQRGGYYRRYSDDILFICDEKDYAAIESEISKEINDECLLKINGDKTERIFFSDETGKLKVDTTKPHCSKNKHGLQYLGFEFDGQNIRLRPYSLTRFYAKIKSGINAVKIRALNNPKDGKIWKKKIVKKYSFLGRRNFIRYAERAFGEIMTTDGKPNLAIKKQIAKHRKIIDEEIKKPLIGKKK